MTDLVAWLRAQLDDDGRVAQVAAGPIGPHWHWDPGVLGGRPGSIRAGLQEEDRLDMQLRDRQCGDHIARHDPAAVLCRVDAMRRIVDLHQPEPGQHPDFCGHDLREMPCPTLRHLAAVYADRDGYREQWRP